MRWSVTTSFVLHTAVLLACVVALPSAKTLDTVMPPSVPVELLSLSDLSQRQAVSKDAPEKPAEKVAPPKPEEDVQKAKPKPEPAPKPTEAAKAPAPAPEPTPKPAKQAEAETPPKPADPEPEPVVAKPEPQPEPEKVPEKKAEAQPAPKPKAKPKPPAPKVAETKKKQEPEFNPDDIAALLNKIPDAQSAAQDTPVDPGQPLRAEQTSMIGSDNAITADEREWLRSQIQRCWSPPTGVMEASDLVVRLRIAFNIDGSVAGDPQVANSSGSPLFRVAADAAVRAVLRCQPYQMPQEKYDSWRDVILNFDPSHMFPS